MMQLTRTVIALVSVVVAFAACDDPVQMGVDEDLVGTYDLITYRGWPIPYSQSNDAFYHRGGTLELRRSGRFIKTELITGVTWTIHGDYFPRGERVALVQDDGVTYTFSRPRAGVLTDPGCSTRSKAKRWHRSISGSGTS